MLEADPGIERHLRKALRIPADVPLLPSGVGIFCQYLLVLCPIAAVIRIAKARLKRVGTYEGRQLVFELQVKRSMVGQSFLTESFDYALRNLDLPRGDHAFRDMRDIDINWMRACVKLGERSFAAIRKIADRFPAHGADGLLVLALVDSKVITKFEELALIPIQDGWHARYHDLSHEELQKFRHVAALLEARGMETASIVKLVNVPVHCFHPQRLNQALSVFNFSGEDLTYLFEQGGSEVLFADADRWIYLRDVLGVSSAAEAISFRTLLETGRARSTELAREMRRSGADLQALAASQALLLAAGDAPETEERAICAMGVLVNTPYVLTFAELALAEDYLLHDGDLTAFLHVLVAHGYGHAQGILAFQCCYKRVRPDMLNAWLVIAAQPATGQKPEAVAEWIRSASASSDLGAFQYLHKSGELTTFNHLYQALKIAPLGAALLRYVREVRGRTGLKSLLAWYFKEAPGICGVRMWGICPVTRVLLDDAFERKNFTLLESNKKCVNDVLHDRVKAELERFPFESSEADREAHRKNSDVLHEKLSAEMVPKVAAMLMQTDGVLLPSLMQHIDESPAQISVRITALSALLNGLLEGGGPTGATLDALEVDLIAMVYRSDPETIQRLWLRVTGRESDVPAELVSTRYETMWRHTEIQLDSELDKHGLHALLTAFDFADQFRSLCQADMFLACRHLSPKRLRDNARDVKSLAQHLGVLLAVAASDTTVRGWLETGAQKIAALVEAGPQLVESLESLAKLLDADLKDALDVHVTQFVSGLPAASAALLRSRLDVPDDQDTVNPGPALAETLARTREIVLEKYARWVAAQRKRLVTKEVAGMGSAMSAMVSKSPAAFFAKEAAAICTRSNTAMWAEARNAHLLVFAPGGKRLGGMALLYFQNVSALDPGDNTLIIRAINPMPETLALFSVSSIVDSYFDLAIRIAKDMDCAAVAFPHPGGMHLMSNHQVIEKDIKTRFIDRAHERSYSSPEATASAALHRPCKIEQLFYAYEHGQTPVQSLFVIWHRNAQ